MAHLPPVTWNEVATKDDVRGQTAILRSDIEAMGAELRGEMQVGFAGLRTEFIEGTNRQIKWLVTFAAVWSSLLVTIVGLIA